MNAKSLPTALLIALLSVAVNAADNAELDPATRSKLEERLHSANDKLNEAAREVGELSTQLYVGPFDFNGSHAVLGLNVGDESLSKGLPGVRVLSVSPGGAAASAGIKANDVIVSFQGKKLQASADKSPRQQLLVMTREARPNTPVAVEIERDGKLQTLKVVPKGMSVFMSEGPMTGLSDLSGQFEDNIILKQFEGFGDRFEISGLGSAEFLELTPGLGKYFGTDKGLLVVHPPQDAGLKLEEGDVILDIDGRVPTDASHALRILHSYRPGESLKLHIMRQQKRVELPIEMRGEKLRAAMLPRNVQPQREEPQMPMLHPLPHNVLLLL